MFSAFQTFGKLGAIGKAIAAAWSPLSLWPDGISSAGMWISPRDLTSEWADYTGTTPVVTPGTVADSSNPVGLALDLRAGATVLTDPGNHMLQATSAARPLLSARVNLLTYTEDFAGWSTSGGTTVLTPGATAPDGTATAYDVLFTLGAAASQLYVGSIVGATTPSKQRVYLRSATSVTIFVGAYDGGGTGGGGSGITLTPIWTAYDLSLPAFTGSDRRTPWLYSTAAGQQFQIWHPQLNLGATALDYQRVGAASDYDSTGFPIAQLYDGVDDGMATAAFAAGTLTSGMDCMIAVRRDSAAATYLISDTASRGFFEWESGNTDRPDVSAGTPTYYVDGVACTATRGALFTALTAGDWHILEARGLDLSTWLKVEVSSLVSYRLNGPRGDILLYPSTASTEDKDAARQWLADYYGVTLP